MNLLSDVFRDTNLTHWKIFLIQNLLTLLIQFNDNWDIAIVILEVTWRLEKAKVLYPVLTFYLEGIYNKENKT